MLIENKTDGCRGLLVPHGSIDSTNAQELEKAASGLDFSALESLTIDFTDVDYISSKCLRILISLSKSLNGGKIGIIGSNSTILDIFRLSGLEKLFDLK